MNGYFGSSRTNPRYGATAVELAFVAPIFFLVIFGMIEFNRMVMVRQALQDSARAGCRQAILATTIDAAVVDTVVRTNLQAVIAEAGDIDTCRVGISPSNFGDMERGTEITTTVEADFVDVSWLLPSFLGDVAIRGEATMKRE